MRRRRNTTWGRAVLGYEYPVKPRSAGYYHSVFHHHLDTPMSSLNPKTYDSTPAMSVAFIGLGVMGFPMAGHLALAGHRVTVYNRNAAKSQAFCQ